MHQHYADDCNFGQESYFLRLQLILQFFTNTYFAVHYQLKTEQGMFADILQCFCVSTCIICSILVILGADSKKIWGNIDVQA